MITCFAPGKMFIAGEWAVLEEGSPGIVAAVGRGVHANITKSPDSTIHICLDDLSIATTATFSNGKLIVKHDDEKFLFAKAAIEAAGRYLGMLQPFSLATRGEETTAIVEGKQQKIGFGSSAAASVVTVAAVLVFHGRHAEKETVYKLATIAHYLAQGKIGSGFDIAASTYGGVFVYTRFNASWLLEQLQQKNIIEIVHAPWPGFSVRHLRLLPDMHLLVGWTKEAASTSAMVKQMLDWKKDNTEQHHAITAAITGLVKDMIAAWKQEDTTALITLLRKNAELLRELSLQSGVPIETTQLRKLSEIANAEGGAGKLSGAGGGDCGIAITSDNATAARIRDNWKKAGIAVIDAAIDAKGVRCHEASE